MHIENGEGRVLPDWRIAELVGAGQANFDSRLIQPASADLALADKVYHVGREPGLGGGFSAESFIEEAAFNAFSLNRESVTLVPDQLYLAELDARFSLPQFLCGYANPKSSAGRIDLLVRTLADRSQEFDTVPMAYKGRLWTLITPRSFPTLIHSGQSLQQIRFACGEFSYLPKDELEQEQSRYGLVVPAQGDPVVISQEGIVLHLDLRSTPSNLVANRIQKRIDTAARGSIDPRPFFREKNLHEERGGRSIILDPGDFLLCRTREKLRVPRHICMEMAAISLSLGQYSSHAAGFFDPGFGGEEGQVAVCEVTNIGKVPITLNDGQRLCVMKAHYLAGVPSRLYGHTKAAEPSHYATDNASLLAKYFQPW